jgi:drug/metabolite transporter (DMT)-like permease
MDENTPAGERTGILLMLIASASFAAMGYFVKLLSRDLGTGEIVFFRNLIGAVIIIPAMLAYPSHAKGGKLFSLVMRGVWGFLALGCLFYSISAMPLGTATTLTKIEPVCTAILAWFLLKEKQGVMIWAALLMGFAGIVMIMKPDSQGLSSGTLSALLSGFFAAAAYTTIRSLKDYYTPREIVLSFTMAGVIAPPVLYFMAYHTPFTNPFMTGLFHRMPNGLQEWFYMLMVGILALFSQLLMTRAFSLGRASIIAPIGYSILLFSTIAGILAGDKVPDTSVICGILLVAASGVTVSLSSKHGGIHGKKRRSNNERKPHYSHRT